MPLNNSNRHILMGTCHQITLVSNGFNHGGPLQTFVSNYGLGDGKMCQLDE
jgi:hypothetical protein